MRPLPFNLEDLRAFAAVVETGSFARAAQHSNLSKSVLSRRVASLEYALGAQLLIREQRGTRATEAGVAFYQTAADVLSRLDQARDDAAVSITQLVGSIRITAPLSFGVEYLAPVMSLFAARHPQVDLDIKLDDRVVDLAHGGFDLGIRIGRAPDSSLMPRLLAPVTAYVVASPAYLKNRGRPSTPKDLAGHDVLKYTHSDFDEWHALFGHALDTGALTIRFRADNGEMLRQAAIHGLGLVILPSFLIVQAVREGQLETVLPVRPLRESGVYAVIPQGRPALRRVRALIETLANKFGPAPPWERLEKPDSIFMS